MSNKEDLQEKYEDALLSILMYEVAQADGKAFLELNERAKDTEEGSISPEAHQRCLDALDKAFVKKKRQQFARNTRKLIPKILMVAALASMLFVTAYAAIPEVRVSVKNLMLEVTETHTRIAYEDSSADSNGHTLAGFLLPDAPAGVERTSFCEGDTVSYIIYGYENGANLDIQIVQSSGTDVFVDTEDASVENMIIENHDVLFVQKVNRLQATWFTGNAYITVTATDMSKDTVVLWIQEFFEANNICSLN